MSLKRVIAYSLVGIVAFVVGYFIGSYDTKRIYKYPAVVIVSIPEEQGSSFNSKDAI